MARKGLLPTPAASDAISGPRPTRKGGERLTEVVAGKSQPRQPEPPGREHKKKRRDSRNGLYPTPLTSDAMGGGQRVDDGKRGMQLKDMVKGGLLPTPTSADSERSLKDGTTKREGGPTLAQAVGLLPTPTARDWKGSDLPNRDGGPSLPQAVMSLWPTPTASDGSKARLTPSNNRQGGPTLGAAAIQSALIRLPTPTTNPQAPNKSSNQKNGSPCLEQAALALIPTPSATKGSRRHGYMIEGNAGTTLTDFALGTSDSPESRGENALCLNPRFVEWLMGWPENWTKVV